MIIGKDIHPERKIYFFGALVLEILSTKTGELISSFSIFEELKLSHNISTEVFLLTLDWLYMLDAIEGKKGFIKKCF